MRNKKLYLAMMRERIVVLGGLNVGVHGFWAERVQQDGTLVLQPPHGIFALEEDPSDESNARVI